VEYVHSRLEQSVGAGFLLTLRELRLRLALPPASLALDLWAERLSSQPLRSYHSTAVLLLLSWADYHAFKHYRLARQNRQGGENTTHPCCC
jgi:hypothetical protein